MPSTPLFDFGHGLSYMSFEYGPLNLASDTVQVSGEAKASLTVTNAGQQRGTEVVQLYAADTATGVTLPAQQLVGFVRVELAGRVEDRHVRCPDERARLHRTLRRIRHRARSGGTERGQQLERHPVNRHIHYYGRHALHQR
jgi:hypothetical protein